jgi:hypothetical protein
VYEKLLSHKIVGILLKHNQNSFQDINLKEYGITYLQRIDERKRQEMIAYIEQKVQTGKTLEVAKDNKEHKGVAIVKETKVEHKKIDAKDAKAIHVSQENKMSKEIDNKVLFPRAKAVAIESL